MSGNTFAFILEFYWLLFPVKMQSYTLSIANILEIFYPRVVFISELKDRMSALPKCLQKELVLKIFASFPTQTHCLPSDLYLQHCQMIWLNPSCTMTVDGHLETNQRRVSCEITLFFRDLPSVHALLVCIGYMSKRFAGWQLWTFVIVLEWEKKQFQLVEISTVLAMSLKWLIPAGPK